MKSKGTTHVCTCILSYFSSLPLHFIMSYLDLQLCLQVQGCSSWKKWIGQSFFWRISSGSTVLATCVLVLHLKNSALALMGGSPRRYYSRKEFSRPAGPWREQDTEAGYPRCAWGIGAFLFKTQDSSPSWPTGVCSFSFFTSTCVLQ